jgi:hypothetical protein
MASRLKRNARLLTLVVCLALAAVATLVAIPGPGAADAASGGGHRAHASRLDRKACGQRQRCRRARPAADRPRPANRAAHRAGTPAPAKAAVEDHLGNGTPLKPTSPLPVEPAPAAEPTPTAEPPVNQTTPSTDSGQPSQLTVALDAGNYGMEGAEDVRGAVNTVRFDTELGAGALKNFQNAGLQVDMLFAGPYDDGGVCALDADKWVAEALAFYSANTSPSQTPIVEALNEPGGSWFWGHEAASAANGRCYRDLLQKLHESFHAQYGAAAPKVLATIDGGGGLTFGQSWWTPSASAYVDGVIVHPYGGTSTQQVSALGNRALVEGAHALTGEPVYITEIGWPTAIGQAATDDSLQWSETEQAKNLTEFISWAASTGYVREVAYFNYRDFGKEDWYGVTRSDGSHKPSYYALQEASAHYDS